ncbi:MAG TPA: alpha/beta hydrolase [Kofleriaceae bacterium]
MSLRYGALLSSLRSLRGAPGVTIVRPTHAALRYRDGVLPRGTIAPLADVYVPPNPNGASVVLVHGGGFVIGSRRMKPMRYLTAQLYAAGIAVCAIDYRMIFRGGRIDEATTDVHDGFEFWSRTTESLGLDPRRISMVGLSAGATLAFLAAARLADRRLARLAACFGLYEAEHLRGPGELLPRLLFRTADRTAWRLPRSAPQTAAPTLLLHGTDDGLVPVEQARQLAAHRESLGLPTKLVIYDGAPHGFFNVPVPAAAAATREIIDHVTA